MRWIYAKCNLSRAGETRYNPICVLYLSIKCRRWMSAHPFRGKWASTTCARPGDQWRRGELWLGDVLLRVWPLVWSCGCELCADARGCYCVLRALACTTIKDMWLMVSLYLITQERCWTFAGVKVGESASWCLIKMAVSSRNTSEWPLVYTFGCVSVYPCACGCVYERMLGWKSV